MKNLYKSLANFQQEVPTIHKATQGFGYTYADLTAIYKVINPLMKKNGLGFTQLLQDNKMVTIVFHIESGETIESKTDIPMNVQLKGMNDFQVMGSAITYLRRYSLSSVLGLVTDKDTDAGGEQVSKPKDEREILTNDRFEKAVEKIRNKQYTIEELKAKFKLNTAQEGALLLIEL
jgi:hypothetical protein